MRLEPAGRIDQNNGGCQGDFARRSSLAVADQIDEGSQLEHPV
jgi:hypothetical protein